MPIRIVPDIKADDRHPPSEKEKRAQRQKEYMEKHGPQQPRRKTLAVTDKYKEVRKKLKDPTGFKPLRASKQGGGRAGFKHGKFVSVASPHVDVAKYVDKTGKELEPERGRSRIKGSEEKVIERKKKSPGPIRPQRTGIRRQSKQIGGRANLLEEMGRLDSERMNPNRRAEKSRVMGELNRGYKHGGSPEKQRGEQRRPKGLGAKGRPSPGPGPLGYKPFSKWPKKKLIEDVDRADFIARAQKSKGLGAKGRLPVGAEGIFGLGVKGKPHSSPEGRKATSKLAIKRLMDQRRPKKWDRKEFRDRLKDIKKRVPDPRRKPGPRAPIDPRSPYVKDRVMTPLSRTKKFVGGPIIKKIISKLKPKPKGVFKPKPVPKVVTDKPTGWSPAGSYTKADDKKINSLLKKLGDEIKAAPLPPQLKKTLEKAQKAFPPKKASGGRISRGYGGSAAQQHYLQHGYGPTKARLRAGKPKIAKKGWS